MGHVYLNKEANSKFNELKKSCKTEWGKDDPSDSDVVIFLFKKLQDICRGQ